MRIVYSLDTKYSSVLVGFSREFFKTEMQGMRRGAMIELNIGKS